VFRFQLVSGLPACSAGALVRFAGHRVTVNCRVEGSRSLRGRPEAVVAIHGGVGREEFRGRIVLAPPAAALPLALVFGYSLVNTFLVESIFDWPGLGSYAAASIGTLDSPAILGVTLFIALVYIVANMALALHLYHGVWSMFQSLGITNPRYNKLRRSFAQGFAVVILVPSLIGFANKFREFILIFRGDVDGAVAGREQPSSYVIPIVTLAAAPTAVFARFARSAVLATLGEAHVRPARGTGAGR